MNVTKMILQMPRLKALVYKGFHNIEEPIEWSEVKFHKNFTLEKLDLIEVQGKFPILKAFLAATPKVKHLTLRSINNESIEFVSQALPHLETLTVDIFEATNVSNPNLFPKITQISAKVFNKNLKIKISEEKPKLSNFESLVNAKMTEVNPARKENLPRRAPRRQCNHHHH